MRGAKKAETAVREALSGHLDNTDIPFIASIAYNAVVDALFPGEQVRATYPWKTNADLLYDVWKLGYVTGFIYDATPGDSPNSMWSRELTDDHGVAMLGIEEIHLNTNKSDFRHFSFEDKAWDTVFFDPPFKLNGNPSGLPELSQRYGVNVPARWEARHKLIVHGFIESLRISKRVLVKCQDQVVSGRIRWQTDMLKLVADGGYLNVIDHGIDGAFTAAPRAKLVDRFDMLGHHIPQPMKGREQKHAHARPSTLLVFERN
jgi:hypothetical protein